MNIQYTPKGVCSRQFDIEVEEGVIQSVKMFSTFFSFLAIFQVA